MEIQELREKLLNGVAEFSFKKVKDGKIRTAIGTTNKDLIPQYSDAQVSGLLEASTVLHRSMSRILAQPELAADKDGFMPLFNKVGKALETFEPKTSTKEPNQDVQMYYDFTVKGWRSFRIDSLI